jgi:hypothetical protein
MFARIIHALIHGFFNCGYLYHQSEPDGVLLSGYAVLYHMLGAEVFLQL